MQTLKAEKRDVHKETVMVLRKKGFLPCVVYGPKVKNQSLVVSMKEFEKVYKAAGETSLVKLHAGDGDINVLIYDVAPDPVTLKPIHADFYAVDMNKVIHAKIPLAFVGESAAVKNEGAILVKVMQEIEVEALPENLPHEITVSINVLAVIGDRITAASLNIPKDVKLRAHDEDIIAIVEAPRAEEVIAPVAAEETVAEVQTEREAKVAEKEAKEKEEAAAENA